MRRPTEWVHPAAMIRVLTGVPADSIGNPNLTVIALPDIGIALLGDRTIRNLMKDPHP